MRTFNSMMKEFKKSLGNKSMMPLLLVGFLIIMLSLCYKNKNLFGAGSMFEGYREGQEEEEEQEDEVVEAQGPPASAVATDVVSEEKDEPSSEGFRGFLRRRRSRQGFREGQDGKEEEEGFFGGRRQGFREGQDGEEEEEQQQGFFGGRRQGFREGANCKRKDGFFGGRRRRQGMCNGSRCSGCNGGSHRSNGNGGLVGFGGFGDGFASV